MREHRLRLETVSWIRSNESYDQKWEYVRDNPVRAGLVFAADAWQYAGEIEALSL